MIDSISVVAVVNTSSSLVDAFLHGPAILPSDCRAIFHRQWPLHPISRRQHLLIPIPRWRRTTGGLRFRTRPAASHPPRLLSSPGGGLRQRAWVHSREDGHVQCGSAEVRRELERHAVHALFEYVIFPSVTCRGELTYFSLHEAGFATVCWKDGRFSYHPDYICRPDVCVIPLVRRHLTILRIQKETDQFCDCDGGMSFYYLTKNRLLI